MFWRKMLTVELSSAYPGVSLPTKASNLVSDLIIILCQVTETCLLMKEHMYTVYEDNGNEMQVKLQELSEVLESCTKLNNELLEANRALASLREGLAVSQTSESQ